MKKRLGRKVLQAVLLAMGTVSARAQLSYAPPALAGYGLNGTTWLRLLATATGTPLPFVPPAYGLYGQAPNGGWYPIQVDTNGNLVSSAQSSSSVTSFNTRKGDVTSQSGDYSASQVTNAVDASVSHPANTVFGNCSASTGTPYWCTITASMIPQLTGTQMPAFTGDVSKPAGSVNTTVTGLNSTNLASLGGGMMKLTTAGAPQIASPGTDYARGLVASVTQSGQTASLSNVAAYTPTTGGLYRLSVECVVTTASTSGGTLQASARLYSVTNPAQTNGVANAATAIGSASTVTDFGYATAGQPIAYSCVLNSTTAGTAYTVWATVEQLQ